MQVTIYQVKKEVQKKFREEYEGNKAAYPLHHNGTETEVANVSLLDFAKKMFRNRTADEIARDNHLDLRQTNYIRYCREELAKIALDYEAFL